MEIRLSAKELYAGSIPAVASMTIKERYKELFSDRNSAHSFVASFAFLLLSLIVNYFSALYAFKRASNYVDDIILSNIPVFNVDSLFIWGPLIFWVVLAFFLLSDPKKLPFTLKSVALFVLIRAGFVSMTHLGPFPDQSSMTLPGANWIAGFLGIDPTFSFILSSGSDLFFSGHTGLPFLLGLIFWNKKGLRIFCVITSIFFGIVVLLGHIHYSIDVASAFFITYTISHIANRLFKTDRDRFFGYNIGYERPKTT